MYRATVRSNDQMFDILPMEFRTLCAKIDDALCDPPYRKSQSEQRTNEQYQKKYHRLMASALIKALYETED